MEQLSLIDNMENGAEPDDVSLKQALEQEIKDPEYIKYLVVSTNKDGSISVKAKSYVAAKIHTQKKSPYIEFRAKFNEEFTNYKIERASDGYSRVSVSGISNVLNFAKPLSVLYIKVLCEFGGESFGCCHRYEACSDERKCLHPNVMIAQACAYKQNLESGRIFYGKNKNI